MRLVTMASIMALFAAPAAGADGQVERIVTRHVRSIVPPDGGGGVAVALRIEGRTLFFNYGWADRANKRPITTDTLFNLASLRKVFEATLLAQAVGDGELRLDDPVAKYVTELDRGGDIGRVTLRQLATHTSGLLLPQDHPPWPDWGYTLSESSARSMPGRRTRRPVSSISIPTRGTCFCSLRSSVDTACQSTS
jgi:beta-lactamase class C